MHVFSLNRIKCLRKKIISVTHTCARTFFDRYNRFLFSTMSYIAAASGKVAFMEIAFVEFICWSYSPLVNNEYQRETINFRGFCFFRRQQKRKNAFLQLFSLVYDLWWVFKDHLWRNVPINGSQGYEKGFQGNKKRRKTGIMSVIWSARMCVFRF